MSNFAKKATSGVLSVTTAVWLSGAMLFVPVASAQQTTADLQAQIASLLAQIQALQAQLGAQSGGTTTTTSCSFTRDLTVGARGTDVKCLQQYLNGAGFEVAASGAGSPGNETETFGPLTRAAVVKWQSANGVSGTGYFGPISRAKYTAVAGTTTGGTTTGGTTTGGTTTVPGTGLVLSLASDNPGSASVPRGATSITFLKFNVAGNGTLDSLVFKRTGIGATADFNSAGLYLYEGNTRLTSGKSINSTTHEVSFVNLGLAVAGVRTLALRADLATGATAANVNAFELISTAGTPTPTGSLKSNSMTIGGQAVGGITIDDGAAASNPKLGQKEAELLEFKLTASSTEDIRITQLGLTEGGTIANENLTNFVIKQAGTEVAKAASIGSKDLVTFVFTTPYLLEKGQEKTFKLYADISGVARRDDTILFYVDSATDIEAIGATYGYPVTPTITNIDTSSETDSLTLQGGSVTITFNGPVVGDLPRRGQDVNVFDFSITSQNNVEIRNLRLNATTTALGSGEGFNDFKLWDKDTNAVISSATDVTTSTNVTVTDVITIGSGKTRNFKVTVDVDADNDDSDDIQVSLLTFQSSDIKNLDNNTFVSSTDVVPNAQLVGNLQDTRVPTLDVQRAGAPVSATSVLGTKAVPFVGFTLRAINDDIKITSLKIDASAATGMGTSAAEINGGVLNLALYDTEGTRVSDIESLTGSSLPVSATFDNLNFTVKKGSTAVLTVKADLSVASSGNNFVIATTASTSHFTAQDSQGNAPTIQGTNANTDGSVTIAQTSVGDVTVTRAGDDDESRAGIVLAGTEAVLAKFSFTSQNEEMTINKITFAVTATSTITATSATSTAFVDEVRTLKLYDGTTLITSANLVGGGEDAGRAIFENVGWKVGKDQTKTLTVKGVIATIDDGADTGAAFYVNVTSTGFEAQGASAKDTSIAGAAGREKQVFKTKPTITILSGSPDSLSNGNAATRVIKFRVTADPAGDISWKKIALAVSPSGATMSTTTTSNVELREITSGSTNLTIGTVTSGLNTTTNGNHSIAGSAGYVNITLSSEEVIGKGGYKDYEVRLTFEGVGNLANSVESVSTRLYLAETSSATSTTFYARDLNNGNVTGPTSSTANPSFVWSDRSVIGHSETTNDWNWGFYVKGLPSDSYQAKE